MEPKLCLRCARAKLSNKETKPCADCLLLNVDKLAKTRANAARPSPTLRFAVAAQSFSSLFGGTSSKPARATRYGMQG